MEVVPARSYHLDVRPYRVDEGEVRRTLEFLRENHQKYYLLYRLMLESGLRVEHALRLTHEFASDEEVEVPGLDLLVKRLVVADGFVRYYCGFRVLEVRLGDFRRARSSATTAGSGGPRSPASGPI